MTKLEIIAEVIGTIAVITGFFIPQLKTRGKMLLFKFSCDIMWIIHFAILGAYSGMAVSCVAACREVFFARGGEEKKNRITYFVFLALGVTAAIIAWDSVWSLFSVISVVISTTAFWQTSPNKIKALLFTVAMSQTVYAIASNSHSALVNECITMASIIFFFARHYYMRKKNGE